MRLRNGRLLFAGPHGLWSAEGELEENPAAAGDRVPYWKMKSRT